MRRVYGEADTDGNGAVSKFELVNALKRGGELLHILGLDPEEVAASPFQVSSHTCQDPQINTRVPCNFLPAQLPQTVFAYFKEADANSDDALSFEEFVDSVEKVHKGVLGEKKLRVQTEDKKKAEEARKPSLPGSPEMF